ncbi:MAG: Gas vesicle synthesis protein GvpL/GvpF [Dehalococcoidia bacterium]|nr:Gas vesicle synthesis protein GvpL/GvpF [Dehalococcoidia bacterium]
MNPSAVTGVLLLHNSTRRTPAQHLKVCIPGYVLWAYRRTLPLFSRWSRISRLMKKGESRGGGLPSGGWESLLTGVWGCPPDWAWPSPTPHEPYNMVRPGQRQLSMGAGLALPSPCLQPDASWGAGLYLYCVADSPERATLGRIGLGGTAVYTIPFGDVCAVVHRCSARPYGSRDREVVRRWDLAHQGVVDTAWRRWSTVLPATFNAVFQGRDGGDVGQVVREWLAAEYPSLRYKIARHQHGMG